jgi:GH25 family lysozyme M1 (1,4-beta-N-acetylmuramidase)
MAARRSLAWLGLAALTCLGTVGMPMAAQASGQFSGPGQGKPQWDRSNTARTHSPLLLRQMTAAPVTSGTMRSSATASGTTALPGAAQGIDVASYQESQAGGISWAAVYSGGIRFAAIKATEGDYYTNPYAPADLKAAAAAGLTTAAYAFAIPNGGSNGRVRYSASPVVQADDLINYLTGKGVSPLPALMLDVEYDPYAGSDGTPSGSWCYGLSQPAMVSWIASFGSEIRAKTGRLPIIYTPPPWWSACTGGSTAFGQTPVWVPAYGGNGSPPLPAGWGEWNFWQYGQASVSGISGNTTDLDQLDPAIITLRNAGGRASVAGTPIAQQQVTPFTVRPAPALTFSGTGLPAGLTVNSATGQITGWPDKPGTYHASVTAASGAGITGTAPFTWSVTAAPDTGPAGAVRLALGGKCLDDSGNRAANGNKIGIWACNGSAAQHWTVVKDQTLRIHGKCLDVYHGGTASGTRVQLYSCNGTPAQNWRIATRGELVNPHSGLCLTDPGNSTGNGTQVRIATCAGASGQRWTPPAGPVVSGIPGKCLDDSGNRTANGNPIGIWTCSTTDGGQQWSVQPSMTIRSGGKCLDVYHSGTASGTRVDLYSCNGTAAQRWSIRASGSGSELVNPHSGLCLTDPGDSTSNGTWLLISTCTGALGQAWRVQ